MLKLSPPRRQLDRGVSFLVVFRHRESRITARFALHACVASLLPKCSGKFLVGHCSFASLAGHLGHFHLRKPLFRGIVTIPVTMRWLALCPQAALFIDSRLFIPMLHIFLLRTL